MSRPEKLRVPGLRRRWLKPRWHFFFLVGLLVVLVASWRAVHIVLDGRYRAETEPTVVAALNTYQVGSGESPADLVVQIGGEPFDPVANDVPGPLGVDRLAGIRGVLIDHSVRLGEYRHVLDSRYAAWNGAWERDPVMAKSWRAGRFDSADTSAVAMVTPADGPSFGMAPAGTCTCTSCSKASCLM